MELPENELLQYVYKTTAMGCEGINCVLDDVQDAPLKNVLQSQLTEYAKLNKSAGLLLKSRGQTPQGIGSMAKMSAQMMSAGQILMDSTPSKIAEMTIQGNNMGVSKTLRHLHDYTGNDRQVEDLTRKLLATEQANVEQLQAFL